ncbi:MAG: hypothetical protein FKY71_04680 [Spiribacter salinus]|uniref:Uncharacterized protein n=1 Tax=Spiribacter salinus TaxID=1335746 RepID=A0A540VTX1_9GAMM|nr:MAG: hypothetical protein FKY71_04680 [Spiribacter salinus]
MTHGHHRSAPCTGTHSSKPPRPAARHTPASGRGTAHTEQPTGRARSGRPRRSASRHASTEPRDAGEPKQTTTPAAPAAATARVRLARRAATGTA